MTKRRRICGRCGAPFVKSEDDPKRCADCFQPQIAPVWQSDDEDLTDAPRKE